MKTRMKHQETRKEERRLRTNKSRKEAEWQRKKPWQKRQDNKHGWEGLTDNVLSLVEDYRTAYGMVRLHLNLLSHSAAPTLSTIWLFAWCEEWLQFLHSSLAWRLLSLSSRLSLSCIRIQVSHMHQSFIHLCESGQVQAQSSSANVCKYVMVLVSM